MYTVVSFVSDAYVRHMEDALLGAVPLIDSIAPIHQVRLPPIQGPRRWECECEACGLEHYVYD